MSVKFLMRDGTGVRELPGGASAAKLALARNPALRLKLGFRVRVPRGTKRVYIPRKRHYAKTVLTEERNGEQLESFSDLLEPCIVKRGVFGFGLHECPVHLVYIEEV